MFPEWPSGGSNEATTQRARIWRGVGGEGETNNYFLRILLLKLTCLKATYIPLPFSFILLSTFIVLCAFKPLYVHISFRIAICRTKWRRWVLREAGAWELFIVVGGKRWLEVLFCYCWLCIRVNKQCVRVHPHRTSGTVMSSVLRRIAIQPRWHHSPCVDGPLYCQTLFVNIKIDKAFLYVYFLLFISALFDEFPRFSWYRDVGLPTADYCFIYVLHCPCLSQCRIWNYRCIALGVYHNRESEITTVLYHIYFLPLFAHVLTYDVPVRLYVKHSANCAVASHSRWRPSCCFFWIPLHSAALPCCVFYSITSQLLHLRIPFQNLKQNFKSTICSPLRYHSFERFSHILCTWFSKHVFTTVAFIQALSLSRISSASHF
jgi:hypothetical protein